MAPTVLVRRCHCRWMSWAIEEMLNIVWCLASDVEASILTDSALVGAKASTLSGWLLARVVRSLLVSSFSEMWINGD